MHYVMQQVCMQKATRQPDPATPGNPATRAEEEDLEVYRVDVYKLDR